MYLNDNLLNLKIEDIYTFDIEKLKKLYNDLDDEIKYCEYDIKCSIDVINDRTADYQTKLECKNDITNDNIRIRNANEKKEIIKSIFEQKGIILENLVKEKELKLKKH